MRRVFVPICHQPIGKLVLSNYLYNFTMSTAPLWSEINSGGIILLPMGSEIFRIDGKRLSWFHYSGNSRGASKLEFLSSFFFHGGKRLLPFPSKPSLIILNISSRFFIIWIFAEPEDFVYTVRWMGEYVLVYFHVGRAIRVSSGRSNYTVQLILPLRPSSFRELCRRNSPDRNLR